MTTAVDYRVLAELKTMDWKTLIEEKYRDNLPLYKVSEVPPDAGENLSTLVLGGEFFVDTLIVKHQGREGALSNILMKAKAVALHAARILLVGPREDKPLVQPYPLYRRADSGIPVVAKSLWYTVDGKEYSNFDDMGQKFVTSNFFIASDPRVWFGPLSVTFVERPCGTAIGIQAETLVTYEVQ
ncbi:MAG: hypothetical protein ACKO0Z_25140 [Betaproteobacteria bacterium]